MELPKRTRPFIVFCLVAFLGLSAHSGPVRIIFDTDMDTDCDDAGAMALLHHFADLGEAEILATVVSSNFPYSAPCVRSINAYYHRPGLPIGAPKKPGADINRGSRYAKQIAEEFPGEIKTNDDAPDAVSVYRRILAKEKSHSVVIVVVGYNTNLAHLLDSGPDDESPLTGRELIKDKVKMVVCMGGRYPRHLDPGVFGNFKPDPAASVKFANQWPGLIIFSGLGNDVLTGESLKNTPQNNPVRRAYQLYLGDKPARPSWDLFAVLYAVRPDGPYWIMQKDGRNHIFENGTNEWRDDDNPNHWLLQMQPDQKTFVKNRMNEWISRPPK
ncbi:MAG: nucleoside hydrolase [Candidatus Hinthialibacter antarcticus]|nr:nucleoside hydrolase [Candidatus Hinthialibacter antarcticus]